MIQIVDKWKSLSISTKGILILAIPFITLLISIAYWYDRELSVQKAEETLLIETNQLINIESVHARLTEASSGIRGYLLTGRKEFLEPYYQAKINLPIELEKLDQNLTDSIFKQHLNALKFFVQEISYLSDTLLKNPSFMTKEVLTTHLFRHEDLKSKIRQQIDLMNKHALHLIQKQKKELKMLREENLKFTILSSLLCIFTALIAAKLYFLDIVKRIKTLRDNAAMLANGAKLLTNEKQTLDEIGILDQSLVKTSALLASRQHQTELARKEAELANSAKTMFLSRTSHDLRTPLNAIIGFAQILQDALPKGNLHDKTTLILSSSNHLLKLINDLLETSRIEAGGISVQLAHFPLKPIIDESLALLAHQAKEKNIIFIVQVDDSSKVFADRDMLLQILINLISNAIKYGPCDETVTIWNETTLTHTLINVKDQGDGIPAHLRHRLFTPYDRLGAEKTNSDGIGLGLSGSKELAFAMGATITLADHESIFSIHLQNRPNPMRKSVTTEIQRSDLSSFAPIKQILFINENADNIMFIETIIRRQKQIHLHTEATVEKVLDYLKENVVHMIMLDIDPINAPIEHMVLTIRKIPGCHQTPIILLCDTISELRFEYLSTIGVTKCLSKPININQLNHMIRDYLL